MTNTTDTKKGYCEEILHRGGWTRVRLERRPRRLLWIFRIPRYRFKWRSPYDNDLYGLDRALHLEINALAEGRVQLGI